MDIFNENKLYPNEDASLIEHYSGYFDHVFIGLIPFIKILNHSLKDGYPNDQKILKDGFSIGWTQIIENTDIENFKDLNKALMTSIGAFKKVYERQDLLKRLNKFLETQTIWEPNEGTFDIFIKKEIYNICKSYNLNTIIIQDEFYDNSKKINLINLSCNDFIEIIDYKDYHIFTSNKEILFTIDWDFFFFFVAINSSKIDRSIIEKSFEGFWANKSDTHSWTWKKGEVESILHDLTKSQKTSWWNKDWW
jgi:hypothetical protein